MSTCDCKDDPSMKKPCNSGCIGMILPSVCSEVFCKLTFPHESLATLTTLVRLISTVYSRVFYETTTVYKFLKTLAALIWSLASVCH